MTTKITEKNISNISNAAVQWQAVITADGSTNTTAVSGQGYFIDTTSAAHTIVLPSSPSVGDTIQIRDYATSFGTNNITLDVNGLKLGGIAANGTINTNDAMVTLVYSGTVKGWLSVENEAKTNLVPATFISATGGTVTTSGDYKIHTFTGDGCFVVSQVGNSPIVPTGGPSNVDYVVVAGGGSGGGRYGGGGGGGGFRESQNPSTSGCWSASPLATCTSLTVTTTTYPVTVGAGGSGVPNTPGSDDGNRGSNSVFSTITSTGGGAGAGQAAATPLGPGGSGGGGSYGASCAARQGGTGNTPPVSPPQGQPGGLGHTPNSPYATAGGGGATEAGVNGNNSPSAAGRGGAGATSNITGSPVGYAGGGGGSGEGDHGVTAGAGSPCGSGTAGSSSGTPAANGADNRGGGSGAAFFSSPTCGSSSSGNGGKGVVIIRYKYQ